MDRGAHGEEGEAGQVRRGLIHCQALAQGQEGQVVVTVVEEELVMGVELVVVNVESVIEVVAVLVVDE